MNDEIISCTPAKRWGVGQAILHLLEYGTEVGLPSKCHSLVSS